MGYIQYGIIELMNNIPKQAQQPQVQIYWQPVAVPNHLATIQNLQRQNALLKQQLAQLQQQQSHVRQPTITTSQHSTLSSTTRSQQPQLFLSPSTIPHQRMGSNLSPQPSSFLSPRANVTCQRSTILTQHPFKENMNDNSHSQSTYNSNQQRRSGFFKMNSPQNNTFRSPGQPQQVKSPMRCSHLSNVQEGRANQKNEMSRLHSPSFLKNKERKISTPFPTVITLHQQGKMAQSGWQDVVLTKTISHALSTQPTNQNSHHSRSRSRSQSRQNSQTREERRDSVQSPKINRDSIRLPTVDLSMQRSSEISIDKAVRQFRRKGKQQRRDTFLFEMEEKLNTLYGINDRR